MRVTLALAVAATFAACGDDPTVVPADGGIATDADTADRAVPLDDARPPVDANAGDGAIPPTRAPSGLDTRPANPTCVAPPRPTAGGNTYRFTEVFGGAGLAQPMVITQIPGDRTRFFAAEVEGAIVSFSATNPTSKRVVGRVPGDIYAVGESGLLGMAFHPNFAANGYVYLSFVRIGTNDIESLIIRMQSPDNGLTFGNPVTILGPFAQPAANHKGGDLHFGPDGYLYASFGDGGGAADQFGHGQEKTGYFSKILRLDVDSAFPFAIPDGNPFKAGGGEPTTFAYGFRNPYRFAVDPVSGNVWAADVGELDWEEVNKVVAGGNYGWSIREGAHCHPAGTSCSAANLVDPYFEYGRAVGSCAISGPIYRGSKMPELVGTFLGTDCSSGIVYSLGTDATNGTPIYNRINELGPAEYFVGFGEDLDHEVYLMTFDSRVLAVDKAPGSTPSVFPDKLSKTGCFETSNPKAPVPAMIPYAPTAPFWSDGAEKDRYFAIPDGTKVGIGADGDFDFPNGSVLAKHFRIDGKLVETRLFVRHADGDWGGYSYEWDDAQTDATLLPADKTRALPGGKSWYYPSRGECFSCHTQAAGRSLGLETAQLDADLVYTRTNRISNQLATLDKIGILGAPIPAAATVPRLVPPFGSAAVDARARSYLHSNCSGCHRPTGPGRSMDLRFSRTLAETAACNAAPLTGDLGVTGARLLSPGNPAQSMISHRMRRPGSGRMPNVATRLVDTQGADLVDSYIRGVTTCP